MTQITITIESTKRCSQRRLAIQPFTRRTRWSSEHASEIHCFTSPVAPISYINSFHSGPSHYGHHRHPSTMATTRTTCASAAPAPSLPIAANLKDLMIDKDGFNWGPWSVEERRVIYEYLNTWIQHHGLDAIVSKTWVRDELLFLASTINEVNATNEAGAAPRSVMGVRRQIRQLGHGRLSPLAKLSRRSKALKRKIDLGDEVKDDERFPEMAILVPKIVDGVYTIEGGQLKTTIEKRGQVGVPASTAEESAPVLQKNNTKKQKKGMVIKLSVDWARLHVRKNGRMVILEEGEVWESLPRGGQV